MIFDWITTIASLSAVAISIFAVWQTSGHRRTELFVAAATATVEVETRLAAAEKDLVTSRDDWHAYFAAANSLNSGARVALDREIDSDVKEMDRLLSELSKHQAGLERAKVAELATKLSQILSVTAQMKILLERISERSKKLDGYLKEYRARTLQ